MAAITTLVALAGSPATETAGAATTHACPDTTTQTGMAQLKHWQDLLGAAWIDCEQLPDLTTTGNPYTDPNDLSGMGEPPNSTNTSSGTLNSKYSYPTTPAVPGIQIDGYWPDSCNGFQSEPTLTNKNGQSWYPGCAPTAPSNHDCDNGCHNDGQFVIRIPDDWDGKLMTAGTPGIRDAYSSDYIFSDFAMEKAWAYVSQDKGNMGANFYQDGTDEIGNCGTPWCPAAAIQEWTPRMLQATRAAKTLLAALAPAYGQSGVTDSYAVGISNGGYQVRRALEADTGTPKLYDGGVDWEGTLFSNQENLFSYLPTSLNEFPGNVQGDSSAVQAMAAVGFNPTSQPLWGYHWTIYWGLTQKIYRLEFDPEYTGYSCSDATGTTGSVSPCISPPAEGVPPQDPDASYNYQARLKALPALAGRMDSVAPTGNIQDPMITLHGDQDSLLPIKTDSDIYAQMVAAQGHSDIYRYYTVQGGNHVDPQFDDHSGVDSYGNTVLRPMLPCVRAAIDALDAWVSKGAPPPASHTIPRPANATPAQLANECSLSPKVAPSIPAGSPPPPPTPPGQPSQPSPAKPHPRPVRHAPLRISILTGGASVIGGQAGIRLRCSGGAAHAACRGTLSLSLPGTGGALIGRARFTLQSGSVARVLVRVVRRGLVRLARAHHHRLTVNAKAAARGARPASRRVRINLVTPRPRRVNATAAAAAEDPTQGGAPRCGPSTASAGQPTAGNSLGPPAPAYFAPGFGAIADERSGAPIGGFGGLAAGAPLHHTPVVFVHGNQADAQNWLAVMLQFQRLAGYSMQEMYALSYNGLENFYAGAPGAQPTQPDQDYLKQNPQSLLNGGHGSADDDEVPDLCRFIEAVEAYTGSPQVDIVAHSLGVTIARKTMYDYPWIAHHVAAFVAIAGANHGTSVCRGLDSTYYGCNEIAPGTPWLAQLNGPGGSRETYRPTHWMTIYDGSAGDPFFDPPLDQTSPQLKGADNVTFPGAYHNDLRADPPEVDAYLAFLLRYGQAGPGADHDGAQLARQLDATQPDGRTGEICGIPKLTGPVAGCSS